MPRSKGPTRAERAAQNLAIALLELTEGGGRPPCAGRDEWISEVASDREYAAQRCGGCPLWVACDQVGQTERFGVWASVDRTRHPNGAARASA